MTEAQQRLTAKHGTPAEFAVAVRQCVGEISFDEAAKAIKDYEEEWYNAGRPSKKERMKKAVKGDPKWIKITLYISPDLTDYKQAVQRYVARFESAFPRIQHLYYARYTDLESIAAEVSALTNADWNAVKRFFKHCDGITKVTVEDRGSGSLAHAYAYQAVKRIKNFDQDTANDDDFLDVVHWMANMRGLDYIRESRFYSYAALRFTHKLALDSEKNAEILRQFNSKTRARTIDSLADRLNLLGKMKEKVQGSVKAAYGAPPPKRKRSVSSAVHKGRGSFRSRSVGSSRR